MKIPATALTALTILSGSRIANAVCTGFNIAIGTADVLSTSQTQYDVYDTSCNLVHSLQINTANGVCDSQYFLCAAGTKTVNGYDDPTSGQAYICASDTTSETCGTDTVSLCCYPGYSSPE